MSWTDFGQLLLRRNVKLKTLLTDPTVIVGIGAIYADEILFDAGLRLRPRGVAASPPRRSGGCTARSSRRSTTP